MARKHFRRNRVCSSENYILSKRLHIEYIMKKHEEFEKSTLKITLEEIKYPYVKCFGKLILLQHYELNNVDPEDIIWR